MDVPRRDIWKSSGTGSLMMVKENHVEIPFERIAIAVVRTFPETIAGNTYILIVMDYFSKWSEASIIPNQESIAKVLLETGCVVSLSIFDPLSNFESELFLKLVDSLGIKTIMNRTINRHLIKVVTDLPSYWLLAPRAVDLSFSHPRHSLTDSRSDRETTGKDDLNDLRTKTIKPFINEFIQKCCWPLETRLWCESQTRTVTPDLRCLFV